MSKRDRDRDRKINKKLIKKFNSKDSRKSIFLSSEPQMLQKEALYFKCSYEVTSDIFFTKKSAKNASYKVT